MHKVIILFLLSFFIFQLACPVKIPLGLYGASAEMPTGLSDKAGYSAETPTGSSDKAGNYAQNNITDPDEWDFGKIKQGQVLKHDFLFKNETKDVLKIISINTSCGCTVSETDKKTLKPNESAKINVTFKSEGYSGEVKRFVYVNTDNVDLPVVRFVIKAEVIK